MSHTSRRLGMAGAVLTAVAIAASPAGAGSTAAGTECFDRVREPYTSQVDSHLHFRPFGGPAIGFEELTGYLDKSGVRHASMYGIGQMLPVNSPCTYYLNCPGTPVVPSMKNDFANAENYLAAKPKDPELAVSMTFMDLNHPETIPPGIALYDKEFPGVFRWAGEVNLVKQALFPNHHTAATSENIKNWAPFMKVLRDRGIPITIHSDLGNDEEQTKYLPLMEQTLHLYPENKIVWAHMGLSKELTTMDPDRHIKIMKRLLDKYPNLTLDLSWRVLEDNYFSKPGVRQKYAAFFDRYPTRAIPGTDFVASRDKDYTVYAQELEVTSRINKALGDRAFRDIALGENYYRLLNLKESAPRVCGAG
ncbi:amidohydrolase family protein [Streptomyces melanogenes]|uniref:Amidohydrolase n=1 Tax=Streptomyces melanogenes TaxID=67326 RepID=A0ABZ1XEQ6_9ACTN|nr:amidohydrolase family protein [Streptomyces melanogenes]